MRAELLLDTGVLVALMDQSEKQHSACAAVLERWDSPIVTTEAVLTEALYLTNSNWEMQQDVLNLFLRGAFVLFLSTPASLERAAALLKKYRDLPMDFADATLVALGEQLETNLVFTLARRDFSVYRLNNRTSFEIFP